MGCSLYLDGVSRLTTILEAHFREDVDGGGVKPGAKPGVKQRVSNFLSQQILLRLTLPIHLALIIIFTLNLHILRATASLITGLLTFDGARIDSSAKDLFSLPIDLVSLLFFGAISLLT